jgi:hypothetical protein
MNSKASEPKAQSGLKTIHPPTTGKFNIHVSNPPMKCQSNTADSTAQPTLENDTFYHSHRLVRHTLTHTPYQSIHHMPYSSTFTLAQSPSIGIPVSLIQRVQLLVPLFTRKSELISKFEEVGSHVDQPFRVYSANLAHILF